MMINKMSQQQNYLVMFLCPRGMLMVLLLLYIIAMTHQKKIHWNVINFFFRIRILHFSMQKCVFCPLLFFHSVYRQWRCFVVAHLIFFDDDAGSNTQKENFFFSFEQQNNIEKLWNDKLFSSLISHGNRISVFVCCCLCMKSNTKNKNNKKRQNKN